MIAAMIVVLTTILAPASVAAAEKVDTSKSGSASLVLELPGASDSVKLYQIAEYDSDSKIVMKKEAQDLKVTIDGKESETALGQKAQTLAGKLKTATATGKTDAKLNVKFDKLKLGYYLVTVDKCGSDAKKYEVAPVIIAVPAVQKSTLKYDVAVKLKGQEVKATPVPATTTPKAASGSSKEENVGADDDSTPIDSDVTAPTETPSPTETSSPTETLTETPTTTPTETPELTPTETAEPTPTKEEGVTPTPRTIGTPTARPVTRMPTATPTHRLTPTPTPTSIRYTIVKKWLTSEGAVLDSSYTGVSSLTVDIYRKQLNEESSIKVGSVELYPSNDWTYSWTTPDDGSTWTVTEPDVPEGYVNVGIVSKSEYKYSSVFTITNKRISSETPKEPTLTETPTITPTELPLPTSAEDGTPTPSVTEDPSPTDSGIPTPGTDSDDSNPDFPPDDSSIPDITVTPDPNMWQMSVTKYWIDKNNIALPATDETIPDSLSIQIWKRASEDAKWQKVELVDLTAENKWTYSWMAPDDGATWTVTEDVVPIGFTQMTIKQSKNTVKKTLDFKVTNMSNADAKPAPVQLSVVKYWKDKNGNDLDDKEIKVESLPIQIYRREKDTQAWKLFKTAELTAENAWEYHWGAADDGASWTVTERDVPEGYVLQTPIKLAHNKDNTKLEFRVTNISTSGDVPPTTPPTGTPLTDTPTPTPTNTPTPTPTKKPTTAIISFSVVKVWQTASGGRLSNSQTGVSSLTIDIYRRRPGEKSYTKVDTVELLPSNNWTHSWTAPDDDSMWTVAELDKNVPKGYTKVGITQSKNTDRHTWVFTITNRKTSSSTATPRPTSITRKVTATATPKVTGKSRTSPNTGDNQNIWIPIMTMFGAAVVLVVLARKRVR